jgi:tRNA pseudouridine55 synthase
VAVGRQATKQIDTFLKQRKTYLATFTLGAVSTTQDPEGVITPTQAPLPSQEAIQTVLTTQFIGPQEQVPPMHSAIKIGGKKLYELARQGKEVERPPRRITIYRADLVSYHAPELTVELDVSSGTYIRAIARDVGTVLGCGAYCSALRRTRIGPHTVDNATPMDAITPETWATLLHHSLTTAREPLAPIHE